MTAARITLLSDFGTADGYVGAMKGVISHGVNGAIIDDIAHDIPPGDVRAAAWALGAYWNRYPAGTVHVIVVDPGVGSSRRAIVANLDGRFIVAPDNGIITLALDEAADAAIRAIDTATITTDVSTTFHGRDIFAPVAARLAANAPFDSIGPPINDPVVIVFPRPVADPGGIAGAIIHIDRFGNLITNIPASHAVDGASVAVGDVMIPLRRTYSDAATGELLALVGSRGYVEVSVRDANAALTLAAAIGMDLRMVVE